MKEETIEPQSWSLDYLRMYGYKVTPNTNQSSDGKKVKNKSIYLSLSPLHNPKQSYQPRKWEPNLQVVSLTTSHPPNTPRGRTT